MTIAEQAVNSPVQQTETLAQSTTGATAVVQSLENLTNSNITGGANPTPQTPPLATVTQSKTNDNKGVKFSALMDGKAVEVQATGDSVNKVADSQKGLVDPNLLQAPNHKNNIGKDLAPVLSDSTTTTQAGSSTGKSQALNIPLIQTQLAGNSSADKGRNDLSVVSNLNPQPTTGTSSEVTATTVNHINKNEICLPRLLKKQKL